MSCIHVAGGCNYPEGDCAGICAPRSAAQFETEHKGKCIKEIWPLGHGLEIVFTDDSSLTIVPPFAFKPAPSVKSGE